MSCWSSSPGSSVRFRCRITETRHGSGIFACGGWISFQPRQHDEGGAADQQPDGEAERLGGNTTGEIGEYPDENSEERDAQGAAAHAEITHRDHDDSGHFVGAIA